MVKNTYTGPAKAAAPVFVTVIVPVYLPVARLSDNGEAFNCVPFVTSVKPFTVTVADAETPSPAALWPITE